MHGNLAEGVVFLVGYPYGLQMKYLSMLAWWLLLLFAWQVSAAILDGAHYLFWGVVGIYFLKAGYVGFSGIVYFRYLSFRSQKSYETMVESFNRIAEQPIIIEKQPKISWVNPLLNIVLVIIAVLDFSLPFLWNQPVFLGTLVLDLLVWLLILRYVVRTYWLKSVGRREKIKEFLDNSRSKMRSINPSTMQMEKPAQSPAPFWVLAGFSLVATLTLFGWRWQAADRNYRVNDLKNCMVKCIGFAAERFYQNGQKEMKLAQESCVQDWGKEINFSLDLHDGEIFLLGSEKESVDFFGNGTSGDESLVLDPSGRFRSNWVGAGHK